MIFAASIKFFDGKHPRFTQVPPIARSSVITAVLPSSCARNAAANAVEPEPRITRSNSAVSPSSMRAEMSAFLRHGLLTVFDCLFIFDCLFQNAYLFFIKIIAGNVLQPLGLLIQPGILAG